MSTYRTWFYRYRQVFAEFCVPLPLFSLFLLNFSPEFDPGERAFCMLDFPAPKRARRILRCHGVKSAVPPRTCGIP